MGREKEDFRDNLALIREKCGEEMVIPVGKVAAMLGVNTRTVVDHLPVKKIGRLYYVAAVALARYLS